MADDLIGALRALANKWARRAQETARDAKASGADPETSAYQRGLGEGFYKAATELAEVIKNQPAQPAVPKSPQPASAPVPSKSDAKPNPNAGGRWGSSSSLPPAAPRPAAPVPAPEPTAQAAPSGTWTAVEVSEVLNMLQYAGTTPRDVQVRPDNSVLAIFSRWENITPPQRQEKVQKADFRLVIIEAGFTKDTRDPYLVFGFRN